MRHVLGLATGLALLLGDEPGRANPSRHDQVRIVYDRPKSAEALAIYRDLKGRRVLEGLREIVGGVRLPRSLTLRFAACNGEANAWYAPENRTVTLCYEYVRYVQDRAPKQASTAGIGRRDAVFGPLAQVFLHEAGHALFDLLDVPVLGREEDAADQFAAHVLLELPPAQARPIIDGIAHLYRSHAVEEEAEEAVLADDHSLALQRLYNLLCLAYGADRRAFGYLVAGGALPQARAEQCGAEYDLATDSLRRLFRSHLRGGRLERARVRRAFRWMF
ncbi:hypothetical protein M446_3964 [Methylobacterium sp. 4-46]|uniref:DUF4344 domain-containing metallopeptidase n=1 Tax=unclassified Methylobacterium TaxID=2615210 RepID=UPI000152C098|nr:MULTISPECIES: DUF4344 domain-containing metallopeptidase [Methylobacterium]ACA18330.1 hypothetical protein M446_3964 [Methylobacterium sp. 4-46]WFT77628.1 DUF4344 domain-containing metallopeptidase [Methylobacterium nodulans]